MVRALLVLLLPLAAGATEWIPGTQPEHVACVLVRDARTGAPLAGVRVAQYLEDASDSFLAPELLAETTTDGHGIACIAWREPPRDCHWVFDKAGFAVREEYGHFPPATVELSPGRTVTARVFGPFGAPRAGVTVEAILGCSHGPAVRRAVTDAQGRFTLTDLDPRRTRLWYVAPDLDAGYSDAVRGDIHAWPGLVLTGRVLDDAGRPVAGAVVGSQQEPRGPRILSAPDGSFAIPGFRPGEGIFAWAPTAGVAYVDSDDLDLARPFRITLHPRETGEVTGRPDPDADEVEVRIEIVDADTGALLPDVAAALRREDGWLFPLEAGVVEAPPGPYELRVGGGFESHVAPPRAFVVRPGDEETHRIPARRQPEFELEHDRLPEDVSAALVTAAGTPFDMPAWLPFDARAVARVEGQGLVRLFPVGPPRAGKRAASIEWPAPRRIEVGADHGFEVRGAWSEHEGDVLLTHATGSLALIAHDRALGEQEVAVDAEGRVAPLRAPGELTVLRPDGGAVATGAEIRYGRLEHTLDPGTGRSWCLRDGAHVHVEHDGLVPLRRTLEGDGPYALRWGDASLELRLAEPLPFVVCVDGALLGGPEGRLLIGGLDAGAHTLLVGARGRRVQVRRLVLAAGETRTLVVALERR